MKYRTLDLVQGSPEWKEIRRQHLTASQVAVVLGLSPYQTVQALYDEKVLGHETPINEYQKRLFAKGHETETSARQVIEKFLNTVLRTSTLVSLEHPDLLASLDGHCERTGVILEAKFLGKLNFDACRKGEIQVHHLCQIQAQLLVTGAERCLYHATSTVDEALLLEVTPDLELQKVIAGAARDFMFDVRGMQPPVSCLEYSAGVAFTSQNRLFKFIQFT